ncbi:hypothetical protein V8G54_011071 [Vigna mungo]|uniref:Uncharacterized protein n=1 Tax=Vigna mungo TaxID=3915 RepID=A0AAQ3NPB6_VIGMU
MSYHGRFPRTRRTIQQVPSFPRLPNLGIITLPTLELHKVIHDTLLLLRTHCKSLKSRRMLKSHMASPSGAVGVKLQLSVLGLNGLCFFQNMFEVSLSDEGSVAFVKGEFVEPFLIRRTIDRKGVPFGGGFVGTPPELHPLELLYDLFIVIHAKDNRGVCVFDFDDFSSEP